MTEISTELLGRLVTDHERDGRCNYDPQAKSEVVQACFRRGVSVSVSRIAMQCGVNANLLRRWIVERQLEGAPRQTTPSKEPNASETSFVALRLEAAKPAAIAAAVASPPPRPPPPHAHGTVRLHVRLPNRVQFDLHETRLESADGHRVGRAELRLWVDSASSLRAEEVMCPSQRSGGDEGPVTERSEVGSVIARA